MVRRGSSIMTTMTARTMSIPRRSAVVGEFNANFSNGAVAGGFGATRTE